MRKTVFAFLGLMGFSITANAADAVKVASQQYVDRKDTEVLNTVSTTYETKENVSAIGAQVDTLDDSINNPETGVIKQVGDVVEATAVLDSAVSTLTQEVEGKEDSVNKATVIGADNQSSSVQYPSVGAIVQWTNDKITELSESGLPVNPDSIGDGSITESKLANGSVTTEKIADDAVTEDKLSNDVVSKIDGKADQSYVDSNLELKEDKSNKIQAITAESTADQYPSAVAVRTALEAKMDVTDLSGLATKEELANYATTEQLNTKEDKSNMVQSIRSVLESEMTKYPSEMATAKALENKADKGTTLAEYGITDAYTKTETDDAIDAALEGAMTGDLKSKEDVSNKVSQIDALNENSVEQYTSVKAVTDYAIPKPDENCMAESGRCVLSVNTSGELTWVDVTVPAE